MIGVNNLNLGSVFLSLTDIMGPDTELLLVNALYFKGKWQYTFEKEDTIEANFTDSAGEIMKVNMMRSNLTISAGHACCGVKAKVAVLPYNQDVSNFCCCDNRGLCIVYHKSTSLCASESVSF